MLPRAAIRSLRYCRRTPFPAALSPWQQRTYAKNSIPKRPSDYRSPSHRLQTPAQSPLTERDPKSTDAGAATPVAESRNAQKGENDYKAEQVEFESNAQSETANAPTSSRSSSQGIKQAWSQSSAKSDEASTRPDYSNQQEEFRTAADPGSNTVPQNDSPSTIDQSRLQNQGETPTFNIHDLTKGIPSTLDEELRQAATGTKDADSTSGIKSDLAKPSSGGRGDRPMPASAYTTSGERRRNRMLNYMFASVALFGFTLPIYLGRNWETEEEERHHSDAPSGWALGAFYNRIKARMSSSLTYYTDPVSEKLLPDVDPAFERPYTLVLSLEDLLIHSEWTREHGYRIAKRPGLDYFLRYLSQYYELVLFTTAPALMVDPVLRKLDPFRVIVWPLFREHTLYQNGQHIKDLSGLNRPLSKTIIIDTVPGHVQKQPENAIILPKWTGDPKDNGLVALIPFLEYVAAMQLDDTRTVLASYAGKEIPTEFAFRSAQAREEFNKRILEERTRRPKVSGIGMLASAFGIKTAQPIWTEDGGPTLMEGLEQGKMLQDLIRERGQRGYELIDREYRENGDKFLKQMAEDEEKMKEEQMKAMKGGLMGWFGKKGEENK